jgi:hypothetical protein
VRCGHVTPHAKGTAGITAQRRFAILPRKETTPAPTNYRFCRGGYNPDVGPFELGHRDEIIAAIRRPPSTKRTFRHTRHLKVVSIHPPARLATGRVRSRIQARQFSPAFQRPQSFDTRGKAAAIPTFEQSDLALQGRVDRSSRLPKLVGCPALRCLARQGAVRRMAGPTHSWRELVACRGFAFLRSAGVFESCQLARS